MSPPLYKPDCLTNPLNERREGEGRVEDYINHLVPNVRVNNTTDKLSGISMTGSKRQKHFSVTYNVVLWKTSEFDKQFVFGKVSHWMASIICQL